MRWIGLLRSQKKSGYSNFLLGYFSDDDLDQLADILNERDKHKFVHTFSIKIKSIKDLNLSNKHDTRSFFLEFYYPIRVEPYITSSFSYNFG